MKKCGSFMCEEDMISLEDLTEGDCVGIEDDKCVSCDTLKDSLEQNSRNFYKNPAKFIFNEELSDERLEKLWLDISSNCGIKYIVLQEEKVDFISPDTEQAKLNYLNLVSRMPVKYHRHLKSMKQVIDTSSRVSVDVLRLDDVSVKDYDQQLKQEYREYLKQGGWQCLLIHNPRELPYIFALLLQKMYLEERNMEIFMAEVDKGVQVCAEGFFQLLLDKLY